MFRWISNLISDEGIEIGKNIIDAGLKAEINELKTLAKNLKIDKEKLQIEKGELINKFGKEKIQQVKDYEIELKEIKLDYKRDREKAIRSKVLYEQKLSELISVEEFFNLHVQTKSQEIKSVIHIKSQEINALGQKVKGKIQDIENATNEKVKKIEAF